MLAAHGDLEYLRQAQQIARWSEDAGCEAILVYTAENVRYSA